MDRIFIIKGEKVSYKSKLCTIVKVLSVDRVMVQEDNSAIIHTIHVKELKKKEASTTINEEVLLLSDKEWFQAKGNFNIIKPLIGKRNTLEFVQEHAKQNGVSQSSIYRWLRIYNETGLVSSLAGNKRKGSAGKSRLLQIQESIIQDKIHSVYLTNSRKSIKKTFIEIQLSCEDFGINYPCERTVRRRIKEISEETKVRKRLGTQEAKYKFNPIKGHFPGADYPLSVVQIDHTPVDIILVDEQNRNPHKRPWLTCAIDIYSRMVVGFYLSFDAPGVLGTGICISNSILPKEIWLETRGIDAEWPCWGIMDEIHLDNAKEFKSKSLRKTCEDYGININYRPIGSPHHGGHIERLLGTFAKEIHNLPGTTFSNVQERKRYQSEKKASFTLTEFEKWLAIYITNIYHVRTHSELNMSPIAKYNEGFIEKKGVSQRNIPPRINNERKVRLDFLPIIERSVQEYGVVIDHIYYYSDVLRQYIHDTNGKNKVKHIFKRDPRDISILYFFDPQQKEYHEIPYRDPTNPPISIWEHREVRKALKDKNIKADERILFQAYRELNEIEASAIRSTKNKRKNRKAVDADILKVNNETQVDSFDENIEDLLPFEDL